MVPNASQITGYFVYQSWKPNCASRNCRMLSPEHVLYLGDEKLERMLAVIDHDGRIIHMFKCWCRDRVWDD